MDGRRKRLRNEPHNTNTSKLAKIRKVERAKRQEDTSELEKLKNENLSLRRDHDSLRQRFESLRRETEKLTERLHQKNAECQQLLTRLSAIASSRLRDNNPNIADLSDENRPTKIGEKMSELYDNEWTDAFDELQNAEVEETDAVRILYLILMRTYRSCVELSEQQLSTVRDVIGDSPDSVDLFKSVKDFRKKRASMFVEQFKKIDNFSDLLPEKIRQERGDQKSSLHVYICRCRELCWYIVVQDPAMVLLDTSNTDSKLDTKLFREYTARGPYIQYVVWPPLLLYADGPVVAKGVAQGGKAIPE